MHSGKLNIPPLTFSHIKASPILNLTFCPCRNFKTDSVTVQCSQLTCIALKSVQRTTVYQCCDVKCTRYFAPLNRIHKGGESCNVDCRGCCSALVHWHWLTGAVQWRFQWRHGNYLVTAFSPFIPGLIAKNIRWKIANYLCFFQPLNPYENIKYL